MKVKLTPLPKNRLPIAQEIMVRNHYLHARVDARCSVEGYAVYLDGPSCEIGPVGYFLLGRPQATRCRDWYGGVDDVAAGRCKVTRWQVLNLARVWLSPMVQPGGVWYGPDFLPGFVDRRGVWRSALASTAVRALIQRVGYDYLVRRPPCFLDEPYQIEWLMSYCDTRLHRGVIYQASGFELYRTNGDGIQTWRVRLPALTAIQDLEIKSSSARSQRSEAHRARRAQLGLWQETQ